jgi:HAD superfamily hydrolase (TIGR01509 family)
MSDGARDRAVLLFDLGGVLVAASGLPTLQQWLPALTADEISWRWHSSQAVGQFERGQLSPEEFARRFVDEWQLTMPPPEFLGAFTQWVRGFYPGAQALLQRLRRHHTVACLSNTNAAHWAVLGDVRNAFDVCVASHLIGHMKPDRAAFDHALRVLAAPPHSVCFFDDLMPNVEAARALGIQAFHVRGVDAVEMALRHMGITKPGDA